MPHSKLPLDQRATQIHERMGFYWDLLCDAASDLSALEDHYDLREDSIEMIDHTYTNIYDLLNKLKYEIDEAENWMFNGYSLQEISEDDLAEVMGYEGQKENYEDHKDKDGM